MLQTYVAAKVRIHWNVVFSSISASGMKRVMKKVNAFQQIVVLL